MVKMIVSIDDLSPDTKRILTAWGEGLNIQIKELRERQSIDNDLLIIRLIVTFLPSRSYRQGQSHRTDTSDP